LSSSKLSIRTRRIALFAALLAFLAVAVLAPLPQSITCPCLVEPSAVWCVMRDGAGQIETGWEQNLLKPGGTQTLVQFQRSDMVDVRLSPQLREGAKVEKGDTVVIVASREREEVLGILESELEKALAERNALLTGERVEDQEIARQEVRVAETEFNEHKPNYDRVKELYETGNVSLSEWQVVQGHHEYLAAKIKLAEATLKASQAGSRPQDVKVAQSEITRLQKMVDNARSALKRLQTIVSPISGTAHLSNKPEFLLRIDQTDTMALIIPLPEAVAAKLAESQKIEIRLYSQPGTPRQAFIQRIDYRDNADFSASAVVLIDNADQRLRTGMNGLAKLPIGSTTIWEGVAMKLKGIRY